MKTSIARLAPIALAGIAWVAASTIAVAQSPHSQVLAGQSSSNGVKDGAILQVSDRAVAKQPTMDEMIGQMIMVGFRGKKPDDKGVRAVRRHLKRGTIGGVILFGINIVSPKQTRILNDSIANSGAKLPVLIAVDQEGGHVQRLSSKNGFIYTNSHEKVARKQSPEEAATTYAKMARSIANAGFNVNFGPVVDVDIQGQRNPIIGKLRRSFSANPEKVSTYAKTFINAHHRESILTSAKHFPGHGSSLTDSHKGFTDVTRTWRRKKELAPFKELAKRDGQVDMVMIGHLYHPDFADRKGLPATLSRKAVTGLLRDQVGYNGVAITDDMEMGAIRKNFGFQEAIIKAVNAGNDILLYSNTAKYSTGLGPKIHGIIKKAVDAGKIHRDRIVEAYFRVQTMKKLLPGRS